VISVMREYFRSLKFVLLIVILAFVATSVVYFGAGSLDGGNQSSGVATVNGEQISAERYRRAYGNYLEFLQQVYRQRLTPEMMERMNLPQQVLNELVQEALIVQQAEKEGVRVSDEELRARIFGFRAFQQDGAFSADRYRAVLRQARITEGDFEDEQRRDLQRRKMEALVRDGVKVSEDELRHTYQTRRERVRAAWAYLDVGPLLAQVQVSESDAEGYLKAHQTEFTRPERRRVEYVVVSSTGVGPSVSDADAEAYYTERPAEFETPRRVRLAHVLVRVPTVGGGEAEAKARAKVEDVIRRARAGEDFAKLAREVSEDDATAAQGGDLGSVGPGEMVPAFEQAAFALKPGEITATPVRTAFGYHAIKAVEIQEGGRQPFREAVGSIKEKLAAERSDRAARERADQVKQALQGAADFAGEARKLGLEPRTAAVARGEDTPGIGRESAFDDTVFGLAVGGVSALVKISEGYAVVKVLETLPAGVPPLVDIRGEVLAAMRRERAEALATERAKTLADEQAKGGDFAGQARKEGFAVGETPLFSRLDPPRDRANLPGSVLLAALQTPAGRTAEPVRTSAGVYVVKTLEREAADMKGFEAEKDELRRQVLDQKRGQVWESWVRGLRAQAKIETSPQLDRAPSRP
jgi:peptidyl-prolyl cis-trans isomerase D